MRILLTGAGGQAGRDLIPVLLSRGHTLLGTVHAPCSLPCPCQVLDISDETAVRSCVSAFQPDLILHCAAWTNVDAAELPENRSRVFAVNALGTRYLSEAARECGSALLYLSTDYVFSGRGNRPWRPEDTDFEPLNVYARSKLEGEQAVTALLSRFFIVRIAWAFGPGRNFVDTMLRLGRARPEVRVVCDQVGTPTYTRDLARLLADMAESDKYGIYHVTNSECTPQGYISWYDFACEIFRQAGLKCRVLPVLSREYAAPAPRPMNSRLDKEKLTEAGFKPLPDWKDALSRYLQDKEAENGPD